VRAAGQGGDRVRVDDLRGLGDLDAVDLTGRALDVGDVDQAGVGLAGDDLAEDVVDGLLLADRLDVDTGGLLETRRCGPARDLRGSARSSSESTFAGLSGGVAILSVLLAKSTGSPVTEPSATALSMFLVSAEAKTSAGAPWEICATRSDDPAKLNATVTPGLASSNVLPISVNVPLSDAAANTVMVVACGAAPSDDPSEPHAAVESRRPATRGASRRFMRSLPGSR
jgi:hypothetical protein